MSKKMNRRIQPIRKREPTGKISTKVCFQTMKVAKTITHIIHTRMASSYKSLRTYGQLFNVFVKKSKLVHFLFHQPLMIILLQLHLVGVCDSTLVVIHVQR